MPSVVTSKNCFYGGKRYRKGDTLEFSGALKSKPSYFEVIKEDKPVKKVKTEKAE